jgi:hypothetical protein
MRWPYRVLDVLIGRKFRNDLNDNFSDIASDMQEQKSRVDNLIRNNPQPSEVVDLRVDTDGVEHPTANDRIVSDYNKVNEQLADIATDNEGIKHDSAAARIKIIEDHVPQLALATFYNGDWGQALQKAINKYNGSRGQILLPPEFIDIGSNTIDLGSTSLIGWGKDVGGITGSGDVILQTTNSNTDITHLKDVHVHTKGNTGLFLNKVWNSLANAGLEMSGVHFTADNDGGTLLKIGGVREGKIIGGSYIGRTGTKGIEFVGNSNGGPMNIDLVSPEIIGCEYGLYADGPASNYLAGIKMIGGTIIGCKIPGYLRNINDLRLVEIMCDNNQQTLELHNCDSAKIQGGWYSNNTIGFPVLRIIAESDQPIDHHIICGARFIKTGIGSLSNLTPDDSLIEIRSTSQTIPFTHIYGNHLQNGYQAIKTICDGIFSIQHSEVHHNIVQNMTDCGFLFQQNFNKNKVSNNTFINMPTGIKNLAGASYNVYNDNKFDDSVATPYLYQGIGCVFGNQRIKQLNTRNGGIATFSGDGTTTIFSITHSLPFPPNKTMSWEPVSSAAAAAEKYRMYNDTDKVYFQFKNPPQAGTNNVIVVWNAECFPYPS